MESPSPAPSSHGPLHFPVSNFHASSSPPASSHSQRRSWRSPSKLFSRRSSAPSERAQAEGSTAPEASGEQTPREHYHEESTATDDPKWWRIRFFRGMIDDVKRRAPYYWSDWADAWDYRVVPATVYMYFAKYVWSSCNHGHELPGVVWKYVFILTRIAAFYRLWLSRLICLRKLIRATASMRCF